MCVRALFPNFSETWRFKNLISHQLYIIYIKRLSRGAFSYQKLEEKILRSVERGDTPLKNDEKDHCLAFNRKITHHKVS
jgi:hypothetical protein